MKRLTPLLSIPLLAFVFSLTLGGCTYAAKVGKTGEDAKTKTTLVSVFSKADVSDLSVDTELTPTNYVSGTKLDSASIDPETETIPAALGVVQQSNEFNQQMQLLLMDRLLSPPDPPTVNTNEIRLASALESLAESQARIEALIARRETAGGSGGDEPASPAPE